MNVYLSYSLSKKIANISYRDAVDLAVSVAKRKPECFLRINLSTGNKFAVIPTQKYTFIVEKNNVDDYFVKEDLNE